MKASIQGEIIAAGLNPSIGLMHSGLENKVPLVYDLMEPLRPIVDREIVGFALEHTFSPGDFTINSAGGCRLNPQMAKAIANLIDGIKADHIVRTFVGTL